MLDSLLNGVSKTVDVASDVIPKVLPLIEMLAAL